MTATEAGDPPSNVRAMLEARSVAVVGASAREGTFGHRVVTEVARSAAAPRLHLVNPRYDTVLGRRCVPSLDDVPEPVDLVLLAVPDGALERELARCADRGDRAAVIYGSVHDDAAGGSPSLRERLAATARVAGMAVCGGGCMGFVNVEHGLRAIGYLEPDPVLRGGVALVTHSGSAFSALLRTNRAIGYTVAVSSGQELVTSAGDYLAYALELEATKVVALVLETLRDAPQLRAALARAAASDVPVVALTVGGSPSGRAMVAAHSGALAGDDAAWEALFAAYGVVRVGDLDELVDTLELFSAGRRAASTPGSGGIATVHDSGAERALVVDVADRLGVRFATVGPATLARLGAVLDPGLVPGNPLDVWGTGSATRQVFGESLMALADDDEVALVALSVDLVHEYDGDEDYALAALDAHGATTKPVAVLSNLHSAIDDETAARLRSAGIPVLEGTRNGLAALGHLLAWRDRPGVPAALSPPRAERVARWAGRLASGPLRAVEAFALLADYGIAAPPALAASDPAGAVAAARTLGYPVVLKTDDPAIEHKTDVGGVVVGLGDDGAVAAAYAELAARLGPDVVVSALAEDGVDLALGIVVDPLVGPIVVAGAGGVLVELLGDRAVALPPVSEDAADGLLSGLRAARLLEGVRGAPASDRAAVARAISSLSTLALELGDHLAALDVNPLRCGPNGALALDALVVARS